MNKEEVDKFCKEYYGFTLEDADGSIGYWMSKYQELQQENKELQEELQKADSITQSCIFDGKEESQLNYRKAIKTIEELHNKIDYLKSKIENKDAWCQLIADIGYDYDGYRDSKNLMNLIDELVKYSLYARDNYDYEEFLKDSDVDE